ncbi:hypothetical protein GE09DRAFT_389923 [Coniochaeta sp. 2T2.1]|nr:hypothetical protein GE09DRAFT_389923 [Coniochaeta sp. 2T2.1]
MALVDEHYHSSIPLRCPPTTTTTTTTSQQVRGDKNRHGGLSICQMRRSTSQETGGSDYRITYIDTPGTSYAKDPNSDESHGESLKSCQFHALVELRRNSLPRPSRSPSLVPWRGSFGTKRDCVPPALFAVPGTGAVDWSFLLELSTAERGTGNSGNTGRSGIRFSLNGWLLNSSFSLDDSDRQGLNMREHSQSNDMQSSKFIWAVWPHPRRRHGLEKGKPIQSTELAPLEGKWGEVRQAQQISAVATNSGHCDWYIVSMHSTDPWSLQGKRP